MHLLPTTRPPALIAAICLLGCVVPPQAATPFDSSKAYEHLRQLVSLGPRPAGSDAIQRSRDYLRQQLSAAGLQVTEQAFEAKTPLGVVKMVNVMGTIAGPGKDRLVIGGHYDTKKFDQFRFVGASDGGSSAAFLIELGRVLKARKNTFTIELLFLDGEEAVVEWRGDDHTYGSRYYVDTARKAGTIPQIKAFVLVDMIGDRNLNMRREANSTPWLTDLIWQSAHRLGFKREFLDESTPIEDDHVPFLAAGVPSVDLIDLDYPPWHTRDDTLDQVSARSLQIVGDVLLDALPAIEKRLAR